MLIPSLTSLSMNLKKDIRQTKIAYLSPKTSSKICRLKLGCSSIFIFVSSSLRTFWATVTFCCCCCCCAADVTVINQMIVCFYTNCMSLILLKNEWHMLLNHQGVMLQLKNLRNIHNDPPMYFIGSIINLCCKWLPTITRTISDLPHTNNFIKHV